MSQNHYSICSWIPDTQNLLELSVCCTKLLHLEAVTYATNPGPWSTMHRSMFINLPLYRYYLFVLITLGQNRCYQRQCLMLTSCLGLRSMLSKAASHNLPSKKLQTWLHVVRDKQPGASSTSMHQPELKTGKPYSTLRSLWFKNVLEVFRVKNNRKKKS